MYECFSCLHVCVPCVWCPWRSKKAFDPLELESQKVVSCHMAGGNRTWVLWRATNVLGLGSTLLSISVFSQLSRPARGLPWYSEADPAIFLLGSPHGFTKTKFNAEGTQNHLEICLDTSQINLAATLKHSIPTVSYLWHQSFPPPLPWNVALSVLLILYSFFKIWLLGFRAEQQFLFRRGTRFSSIPGSYIAAHNHL